MKYKISISIDEETLNKVDINVIRRRFRNRSHAFEYALTRILKIEENQNAI